jgi:hypothetical protein
MVWSVGAMLIGLSTWSFLRANCNLDSLPLEWQGEFGALYQAGDFFGGVYDEDIAETFGNDLTGTECISAHDNSKRSERDQNQ